MNIINEKNWISLREDFLTSKPFNHIIIDDFFTDEVVDKLVSEFPSYNSDVWNCHYNNPIENKKTCNHWDKFQKHTYSAFQYLCSSKFENIISEITGNNELHSDFGLHGGGLHSHSLSGNLNIHLDYSVHPKLNLKRNFNLIVYLTPEWNSQWGGGLELWSNDDQTNKPKDLIQTVENKFNRAVLFDTTQHSWHGLPNHLKCPDTIARQSFAIYYLTPVESGVDPRNRALFVPSKDQINDKDILELIQKRSML
jgi:hypothetical protein